MTKVARFSSDENGSAVIQNIVTRTTDRSVVLLHAASCWIQDQDLLRGHGAESVRGSHGRESLGRHTAVRPNTPVAVPRSCIGARRKRELYPLGHIERIGVSVRPNVCNCGRRILEHCRRKTGIWVHKFPDSLTVLLGIASRRHAWA